VKFFNLPKLAPKKETKTSTFLKKTQKTSYFFIKFYNQSIFNYFLLRKVKIFVKNKYPRNRQWSKNIIYFGVWLNILIVYLTFFYCYHFLFNFGYLWWINFFFFYSLGNFVFDVVEKKWYNKICINRQFIKKK